MDPKDLEEEASLDLGPLLDLHSAQFLGLESMLRPLASRHHPFRQLELVAFLDSP